MSKVRVQLLKPLDGLEIGATTSFDAADVTRLVALGAVKRIASSGGARRAAAPPNKKAAEPRNKAQPAADIRRA